MSWGFTPLLPAAVGLLQVAGNTYNDDATAAASVAESSTSSFTLASANTEAAAAAESQGATVVKAAAQPEAAAADHTSSATTLLLAARSEAAAPAEASGASSVIFVAGAEAGAPSDTQAADLALTAAGTEAVSPSEAQAFDPSINLSFSESVSAAEAQAGSRTATAISTQTAADNLAFTSGHLPNAAGSLMSVNFNGLAGAAFIAAKSITVARVSVSGAVWQADDTSKSWPIQPGTVEIWQLASADLGANPQTKLGEVSFDLQTLSRTSQWHEFDFSGAGVTLTAGGYYAAFLRVGSDWNTATTKMMLTYTGYSGASSPSPEYLGESNAYSLNLTAPGNNMTFYQRNQQYLTRLIIQGPTSVDDAKVAGLTSAGGASEASAPADEISSLRLTNAADNEAVFADTQADPAALMNADRAEDVSVAESLDPNLTAVAFESSAAAAGDNLAAGLLVSTDAAEAADGQASHDSSKSTEADTLETASADDSHAALYAAGGAVTEASAPSHDQDSSRAAYARGNSGNMVVDVERVWAGAATTGSSQCRVNFEGSLTIQFLAGSSGRLGVVQAQVDRYQAWATDGAVELWQLASNSVTAVPQTLLASLPIKSSDIPNSTISVVEFDFSQHPDANLTAGTGYAVVFNGGSDWVSGTTVRAYLGMAQYGAEAYNHAALSYGSRSGAYGSWANLISSSAFGLMPAVNAAMAVSQDVAAGSLLVAGAAAESSTAGESSAQLVSTDVVASEAAGPADSTDALALKTGAATEPVSPAEVIGRSLAAFNRITSNVVFSDMPIRMTETETTGTSSTQLQSTNSISHQFIAQETAQLGFIGIGASMPIGTPTATGAIEIWQLATNSLTSTPLTKLGSIDFPASRLPSYYDVIGADFTALGITLTAGVGYAAVFKGGSDWNIECRIIYGPSDPPNYNFAAGKYQLRNGAYGTWPGLVSNVFPLVRVTSASALAAMSGGLSVVGATTEPVTAQDISTGVIYTVVGVVEGASAADQQAALAALNGAAVEPAIVLDGSAAALAIQTAADESVTPTTTQTRTSVIPVSGYEVTGPTDSHEATPAFSDYAEDTLVFSDESTNILYTTQWLSAGADTATLLSGSAAVTQVQVLGASTSTGARSSVGQAVTQAQNLGASTSIRVQASSSAAISQVQVLGDSSSASNHVSGAAGVTQVQNLAGADSTRASSTSLAVVTQDVYLVAGPAHSARAATTAAVSQVQVLVAGNSVGQKASQAAAVTQVQDLVGTPTASTNASGTAAVSQVYTLVGVAANAERFSAELAVTQDHVLFSDGSVSTGLSDTAAITVSMTLVGGLGDLSARSIRMSSPLWLGTDSYEHSLAARVMNLHVSREERLWISSPQLRSWAAARADRGFLVGRTPRNMSSSRKSRNWDI